MNDLAHWAAAFGAGTSAIAAVASVIAALASLSVVKVAAKQAKDARRSAALREWRHTNAAVIVEGGGCLAALALLRISNASVAALASPCGTSRHEQLEASVNGLTASIQGIVDEAVAQRAQANKMHSASSSVIEAALSSAFERLATVRMATEQCAKLQCSMDQERLRLLQRSQGA